MFSVRNPDVISHAGSKGNILQEGESIADAATDGSGDYVEFDFQGKTKFSRGGTISGKLILKNQLQTTESLSEHIGSDLNLVISMLDGLSNSKYLQEGQLYSAEAKTLLREKYDQYSAK